MSKYDITSGKIGKAQKVVLYGVEGIGKSTFLSQFPGVVFIDTEGSTALLDVSRLPAPTSWEMLLDEIEFAKKEFIIPRRILTLAIDTADWAEALCTRALCARMKWNGIEDAGYGKGYTYLEEDFGKLLNSLQEVVDMGCNVAISAHAQMRKFEQPDESGAYDRYELKLEKKTAALLREWSDMLLFANYETYVVKASNAMEKNKVGGGKRVMYTTHHPCWDAKNRHGLADKLPFEFAQIAHCIVGAEGYKLPQRATAPPQAVPAPAPEPISAPAPAAAPKPTPTPKPKAEPAPAPHTKASEWTDASDEDNPFLEPFPRALMDLMDADGITVREVQHAVAVKGYFPEDTPPENYPDDFVQGVLIGAWSAVKDLIFRLRKGEGQA